MSTGLPTGADRAASSLQNAGRWGAVEVQSPLGFISFSPLLFIFSSLCAESV